MPKKLTKRLQKSGKKGGKKSLFLILSCCCLETGLKPVLFFHGGVALFLPLSAPLSPIIRMYSAFAQKRKINVPFLPDKRTQDFLLFKIQNDNSFYDLPSSRKTLASRRVQDIGMILCKDESIKGPFK